MDAFCVRNSWRRTTRWVWAWHSRKLSYNVILIAQIFLLIVSAPNIFKGLFSKTRTIFGTKYIALKFATTRLWMVIYLKKIKILWILFHLDYKHHECIRECTANASPKTCEYHFTVEAYHTLSKACFDCPFNQTDCFRPHCVPADGFEKSILTVNRMIPGTSHTGTTYMNKKAQSSNDIVKSRFLLCLIFYFELNE